MNVCDFYHKKQAAEKIVMVTCYDFLAALIVEKAKEKIDCVLVGDTVSVVVHGHPNTTMATMDMMCLHTAAVARGLRHTFLIADLPFLAYRQSLAHTLGNVQRLVQAGAQAVKLEGCYGNLKTIERIVNSGVPVMGHLGLTPQSINLLGGHKTQGTNCAAAASLLQQAQLLQQAGCFAIVLECIPAALAATITEQLNIATIGIGAGAATDGQVLVWHDLIGMQHDFTPKFLKRYADCAQTIEQALSQYAKEVRTQQYPLMGEHTY